MQLGLALVDHREVLVERVDGRSLARPNRAGDVERAHGSSPRIGGTRNWLSSTAGAEASTSSRSTLGSISSARNTFTNG